MKFKDISDLSSLSRRKLIEVALLVLIVLLFLFFGADYISISFFVTGYFWNWAVSQKVDYVLTSKTYKFSFFRMVYNLDRIVSFPFLKLHSLFRIIPKSLPCGLFILGLNNFLSSDLSVLPAFLGSFVYELINLESILNASNIVPKVEDLPPEIPKD